MNEFESAMRTMFEIHDTPQERCLVIQGYDLVGYLRVGGLDDLEMRPESRDYRSRKTGYGVLIPPGPLGQDMLPPEMRYKTV